MLRLRRSASSLLLIMTLLLLLSYTQEYNNFKINQTQSMKGTETIAGHIVHLPILINGDADFNSQAASETWSGSGTLGDPYRIENYYIDASTGHGIDISNTQVYFVIYNCTIFGGTSTYNGINLYNVGNGTITENEIDNDKIGIHTQNSDSNIIEHNNVSYCVKGIHVERCDYVTVNNNTCSNSTEYDLKVGDLIVQK